jgi:pimeloyl-ACP methyl ester carboxylesterase
MYNSVGIPGLAMAADEFPDLPGFLRLNNPGVGGEINLEGEYLLEDVARLHADALAATSLSGSVRLLGISMGAAILAIVASKFRSFLPVSCKFFFVVPSPNSGRNPAVAEVRLRQWLDAGRSTAAIEESFRELFSPKFLANSGEIVDQYISYRQSGGNRQSNRSFHQQVSALRLCDAGSYFENVNPVEAVFVHAEDDRLFPPCHAAEIRERCPLAQHFSIPDVGHMVHVERPDLIVACLTGKSLRTDRP